MRCTGHGHASHGGPMTALDYDDIAAGTLVGVPHVGAGHLTLDSRDEMLWHHYAKQQQQQQQQQQQSQMMQQQHSLQQLGLAGSASTDLTYL